MAGTTSMAPSARHSAAGQLASLGVVLWLAAGTALAGCVSDEKPASAAAPVATDGGAGATPPPPQAPPPPRPGPPPAAPEPVLRTIAYLESPSGDTLAAAATASATSPGTPVNSHLAVFLARERGDTAGADRLLRELLADRRSEHAFFFVDHRDELIDLLRLQLTEICQLHRLNLPQDDGGSAPRCPVCGEPYVTTADAAGHRSLSCPHCDALRSRIDAPLWPAFQQVMWPSHGPGRIAGWRGGGEPITPEQFVRELGIVPGQVVADIGAGEGYFTFAIADVVGPSGKVFSEDIDASYAALVDYRARREGYAQIETVVGAPDDVGLPPASVDVAFVCEVYKYVREAPDPEVPWDPFADGVAPTFGSIREALRPGGTLILIEHAAGGARSGDGPAEQMIDELRRVGFELERTDERYRPTQDVLFFRRH